MSYQTIRTFRTARFEVVLDCTHDDDYVLDVQDENGNDCQETADKLQSGEWNAYLFRVRVLCDGREIGCDYLGASIYADPADFEDHRACGVQNRQFAAEGKAGRCGSYFSDMVATAVAEARAALADAPRMRKVA